MKLPHHFRIFVSLTDDPSDDLFVSNCKPKWHILANFLTGVNQRKANIARSVNNFLPTRDLIILSNAQPGGEGTLSNYWFCDYLSFAESEPPRGPQFCWRAWILAKFRRKV